MFGRKKSATPEYDPIALLVAEKGPDYLAELQQLDAWLSVQAVERAASMLSTAKMRGTALSESEATYEARQEVRDDFVEAIVGERPYKYGRQPDMGDYE